MSNCSSTSTKNNWSCIWWCWYRCTACSFRLEMAMWRSDLHAWIKWAYGRHQGNSNWIRTQMHATACCSCFDMMWYSELSMWQREMLWFVYPLNHQTELDMMGEEEAEMLSVIAKAHKFVLPLYKENRPLCFMNELRYSMFSKKKIQTLRLSQSPILR